MGIARTPLVELGGWVRLRVFSSPIVLPHFFPPHSSILPPEYTHLYPNQQEKDAERAAKVGAPPDVPPSPASLGGIQANVRGSEVVRRRRPGIVCLS